MTVEQITQLIGVSAWPITALLGIFVLRPYISQLTRAASDLRDLLDRSGEMVGLVGQVTALGESLNDLKAMEQLGRASRTSGATISPEQDLDGLWKALEGQWQQTRDAFRTVARSAGVPVSFVGTTGVREATKALLEKGVIDEATAGGMNDLSAQYQLAYRSPAARADYLNEKAIAAYAATAKQVRAGLKAAQ